MSAPTGEKASSDSSEYFSDADIAEMRTDLKDIPGMDPKSIDHFVTTLAKFKKNSTEEETMEGVVSIYFSFTFLEFIRCALVNFWIFQLQVWTAEFGYSRAHMWWIKKSRFEKNVRH